MQSAIEKTKLWIEQVIIRYGFCPFAKAVYVNEKIHYLVSSSVSPEDCLSAVIEECLYLDDDLNIETSFIIYTQAYVRFEDYLNAVSMAEALLEKQGYRGIYQIASFHPDYCFANSAKQDAANYTNRSPFPMLHIIRESSLEIALQTFPQPEAIPERNIKLAREMGAEKMRQLLHHCQDKK